MPNNSNTSIVKMREITLPELKFSTWYKWENRGEYNLKKYPGVYIISITEKNNLEGTKPYWRDAVYVGMTTSKKGLAGRWRQFDRSIKGKNGHSGGTSIFKAKGKYDLWEEHLYVAAMGIECDPVNPTGKDYLKMGWIVYLEYEAFAFYYRAVGGHPIYNKK
jgi:hypothetical protein